MTQNASWVVLFFVLVFYLVKREYARDPFVTSEKIHNVELKVTPAKKPEQIIQPVPRLKPIKQLPNFIGIGCKKCGTSAFSFFMNLHLNFLERQPSEAHFFDRVRQPDLIRQQLNTSYLNSMRLSYTYKDIIFEKTPRYFYLEGIPENIARFLPNTKLVLIVCDPVKRGLFPLEP